MTIRTCTLWCPDWPATVARRGRGDGPLAVVERVGNREVVRAASPAARAEGVATGLRRREAEARCAALEVVPVDRHAEGAAFEAVARAVEALTPRIEVERPGRLAFPTRGPARYFGGDEALAARVRAAVGSVPGAADGGVAVGIADGAFGSWLAARRAAASGGGHEGVLVVPPGGSAGFVAPFGVRVLGDDDLADLLVRLGLPTLGSFAALAPAAVLARFGVEGRRLHDLARGLDVAPPALAVPPPDLVEVAELDPPARRVDAAAFAAKGLADRLLGRLAEHGLGCTRVVVEAETEHGERRSRCWRHDGAFTAGALAERVRWQLDGWLAATVVPGPAAGPGASDDPRAAQDAAVLAEALEEATAGLVLLRLVPDEVVALGGSQLGLWGGDRAAADRADRALARVQGMLGHAAVATGVPQGGRTPAERLRWVPWGDPREPEHPGGPGAARAGERPAWPGAVPGAAPARVFDPPLSADLLDATGAPVRVAGRGEASAPPAALRSPALPGGGGRVVGWAGPWAHDVRWWDVRARRRRVVWQVTVAVGGDGGSAVGDADAIACLVVQERGRAGLEAVYD